MTHFTTNTYTLKREILFFSNKISRKLSKPDKKFTADITYGMLASRSCLLTEVVDQLHEKTKKVNAVERLTRHLDRGVPKTALRSYLSTIRKWVPSDPVIHIDDSDIVKPDGRKFEDLGIVRDGSKSTDTKSVYQKGYHVTFAAMERGADLFGKATFVMDRGYDSNGIFLKLDELGQDYVIRLTSKRKLLFHGKWVPATELRERRKGKIKLPVTYKGKVREASLSHVRVQITASRKDIYLVLVYGITDHPMMLATNREIKSREDVIRIARLYFSRWRIMPTF